MELRTILDTLSRSSAQAVSTLEGKYNTTDSINTYLYVETPIERDFRQALEQIQPPNYILFLCGSSGDGKSEILTRSYERYHMRLQFHLDATHSFQPDRNAVQTLDDVFSKHKQIGQPLVVGINIGMLANYAEEGSQEHADIICSIRAFLDKKETTPHHQFLNFEDYPKFELVDNTFDSPFIEALLQKLTTPSETNPFYVAYRREAEASDDKLLTNFQILQFPVVQKVIIQLLLKVHLKYDQFLTTRTILDLIHHLLVGPGYLFDNLFARHSSDLTTALTHFDPCTIRSREIDLFLIQHSLGIKEPAFDLFRHELCSWINLDELQPSSWVRLFYVLQQIDIGNNYHRRFQQDFRSDLYDAYISIWLLHQRYEGGPEQRRSLRDFYQDLINALFRFANRFAPALSDQESLFLGEYNGYVLSTPAKVSVNFRKIPEHRSQRLGYFNACLRIENEDMPPISVNANFLELILKINNGYRPNKHDKNTILILENVISDINRSVRDSSRLHISTGRERWTLINEDDEEIIVER